MGILAPSADERVRDVRFGEDTLAVDLMDGRTITVPLAWYPRLAAATSAQRAKWPEIDEDLSTEGLLKGIPAPGVKKPR